VPGQKHIAVQALNFLRASKTIMADDALKCASAIAFPLGPLHVEQSTPRFDASFAIECLRRSIWYREDEWLVQARLEHAIRLTTNWLESES
jgi:hypothetical protein